MLQVTDDELRIVSCSSLKVKSTIKLNELHIKCAKKVKCPKAMMSDADT